MSMKHIVFLLPAHVYHPCGGVKVVFEYANYLVKHGWRVSIVSGSTASFRRVSWYERIKSALRYPFILVTRRYRPTWFALDERIRTISVPSLSQHFVPDADVYVATAVETAEQLMEYKTDAKRAYLIQDYEDWNVGEERLLATYRSSLIKFVISHWLQDRVAPHSTSQVTLIPNGFDFAKFGCDVPVEKRNPNSVAFMYHVRPSKDVPTGLKALEVVHRQHPDLKVNMFGVYPKGPEVPDWISYTQNPTQHQLRAIYNSSAIYLAASRDEGWGLTVGEAMICGCAICCTACIGFMEMVKPGVDGLVSPVGDAQMLADNLVTLLHDQPKRAHLAKMAMQTIRRFDWEDSKRELLRFLKGIK